MNENSKLGDQPVPQVLKEEIREKIMKSALGEFYGKGFKSATMKDIASAAGIPTGLIYSYFKSKEDLLEKIVQPVISLLKDSILDKLPDNPENNLYNKDLPIILRCIEYYNMEMVILIDKSEGSKVFEIKEAIIDDVTRHLKITPILKDTDFDEIFYHILATNFMEGVFEIARHYSGRGWAETMLDLLIKQHLYGISSLLKEKGS